MRNSKYSIKEGNAGIVNIKSISGRSGAYLKIQELVAIKNTGIPVAALQCCGEILTKWHSCSFETFSCRTEQ